MCGAQLSISVWSPAGNKCVEPSCQSVCGAQLPISVWSPAVNQRVEPSCQSACGAQLPISIWSPAVNQHVEPSCQSACGAQLAIDQLGFDLIKCLTTSFLHTHSWLNWVDEDDEVGVKEKPEDTRYIKKITSK